MRIEIGPNLGQVEIILNYEEEKSLTNYQVSKEFVYKLSNDQIKLINLGINASILTTSGKTIDMPVYNNSQQTNVNAIKATILSLINNKKFKLLHTATIDVCNL